MTDGNSIAPAQSVGNAFVNQYYSVLKYTPQEVHRFYKEESRVTWSAAGAGGTVVSTIAAIQSEIHQKVMALKNDEGDYFKVGIVSIDSQDSLDGGILVMVTGLLLDLSSSRTRNFVHIFFLAPQDTGYFVLNDIFRTLEEETQSSSCIMQHDAPFLAKGSEIPGDDPPQVDVEAGPDDLPSLSTHQPCPMPEPVEQVQACSGIENVWTDDLEDIFDIKIGSPGEHLEVTPVLDELPPSDIIAVEDETAFPELPSRKPETTQEAAAPTKVYTSIPKSYASILVLNGMFCSSEEETQSRSCIMQHDAPFFPNGLEIPGDDSPQVHLEAGPDDLPSLATHQPCPMPEPVEQVQACNGTENVWTDDLEDIFDIKIGSPGEHLEVTPVLDELPPSDIMAVDDETAFPELPSRKPETTQEAAAPAKFYTSIPISYASILRMKESTEASCPQSTGRSVTDSVRRGWSNSGISVPAVESMGILHDNLPGSQGENRNDHHNRVGPGSWRPPVCSNISFNTNGNLNPTGFACSLERDIQSRVA